MKYLEGFEAHFGKRSVFSLRDCGVFLKQSGISRAYLRQLVHYLLKKKRLKRIARGFYTFGNDPIVSGFAFSPFYYGLQEALSLHDLWQQETNPVIITIRKVRPGLRKILGGNVLVRRIDKKMFFGFEMREHFGVWIPVSTIEKTVVDFAYFNEKIPDSALHEIKQRLDRRRLGEFLRKSNARLGKRIKKMVDGVG